MNTSSKLTKEELAKASPQTQVILKRPPVAYENSDKNFGKASEDFAELMEYALGTDEGEVINNALDWKRWELQAYYKKKHNWDIV